MPGPQENSIQVRLRRDNLALQAIIDEQRAEIAELRHFITELRTEHAAQIDALEFALKARKARMSNAVDYLRCSEQHAPQRVAMALQELIVRDADS